MAATPSPSKPSPGSGKSPASPDTGKSQATSQSPGSGKKQGEEEDYSGLEGAVGFTPPAESVSVIPKWNQQDSNDTDPEVSEMRRRRLERFSSATENQGDTQTKNKDSDEFD